MKKSVILIVLFLFSLFNLHAENKTALVIGNSTYKHFSQLESPNHEAQMMADSLERLGFQVTLLLDATLIEMENSIIDFETSLEIRGGLVFFYYNGHSVQVHGRNFLIPVDVKIQDERRVQRSTMELEEMIMNLDISGTGSKIIVLDACRENPLPAPGSIMVRNGLASVFIQPENSVIVYSAEAYGIAKEGIFTPTLLKYIDKTEIEFTDLLEKVRIEVLEISEGFQRIEVYSSIEQDLYLAEHISPRFKIPNQNSKY